MIKRAIPPLFGLTLAVAALAIADGVIYSAEVGNWSVKRYHRYIDP